jgi:hypothetical protein
VGAAVGWTAGAARATPTSSSVAGYVGLPAEPIDYDYGDNVVYQDNSVYIDGSSVAPADQYSQQARQMAARGQASKLTATDQ